MPNLSRTLLVEVGGTNTRCALTEGEPHTIRLFVNSDFGDLVSVLSGYYSGLEEPKPVDALIAVAAPVRGTQAHLTNLDWTVDAAVLKQEFGLQRVTLINDAAALACAIPSLESAELFTIQQGQRESRTENIAVIGPGTGLATSGLIHHQGGWIPVSGEGGHVTLAAVDRREADVITQLSKRYEHVSAERVLSGPGLLTLYNILSDAPTAQVPEHVSALAAKGDAAAIEALDLFFGFLGTVSADLVLTLGARGGLYLGGGILPNLQQALQRSRFIQRFTAKGRYSAYLSDISVFLIVAESPAIRGLNRYPTIFNTSKT